MRSELGAVAVAGVVLGAALLAGDAAAEPPARTAAVGKYSLEIGQMKVGWIQSVEGGNATSDVVTEKIGPDHIAHKHIAGVKYEDITVSVGAGMSVALRDWIQATLQHRSARVDGAVHAADYDGNIQSTLNFFHGLVSEVGFPALDAGSKDAAKMTIKISPEYTRHKAGSGKIDPSAFALGKGEQKKWIPSNFRLDLTDCGSPCKQAVKLAPVNVKLAAPPPAGVTAPPLRTSNIIVTMPPLPDLMKWSAEANGRDGTLEYVTGDGSVFVAFKLLKMRPVRVTVQQQGNKPYVEIELHPEGIELKQ